MLRVHLIGEVEVRVGKSSLALGTPKQQVLLAMLAIQPGRVVGLNELVDELWPVHPPDSAVANTRTYAANLRRLFHRHPEAGTSIERTGGGYRFSVEADRVDLIAFGNECDRARIALEAGDLDQSETAITLAESYWRGPIFAGLPRGPILEARSAAAAEQRLALTEQRAEIHLLKGRARSAVSALRAHAELHPLRERAQTLFVRALYEVGDAAAALQAYSRTRTALVEAMGVEPGESLQRIHRSILARNSPLAAALGSHDRLSPTHGWEGRNAQSAPGSDLGHRTDSPWLPRPIGDFIGREAVVKQVVEAIEGADGWTPAVQLVDGMAGSGKTTLVAHVVRRMAGRFPDGQLFIDLHGHGSDRPVDPPSALATLLGQLGVPSGKVPPETDQRIAMWRAETSLRRLIIVLDNAGSSDQIETLLPVSAGNAVLVTSRRRLHLPGALLPVSLPVLDEVGAVELLARTAGEDRVYADPEAAAMLVRRCGYLPLAVHLAGARLAHRPDWRVRDLAERLGQEWPLVGGTSDGRDVAGAFAASYAPLNDSTKRAFRLLGLVPGQDFGMDAVAALVDVPRSEATISVDSLVDRHLLDELAPGRYTLHDLMRDYARHLAVATDDPEELEAAQVRLLDHYLHAVSALTVQLEPAERPWHVDIGEPLRPDLVAVPGGRDLEWLEGERANLRALVQLALKSGHYAYAWKIARVLWRFYYTRAHFDDIVDTHSAGIAAAEKAGDRFGEAAMHNYLASAYHRTGRYQLALDHLRRAIALSESVGDHGSASAGRRNIAIVYWLTGRLAEGVEEIRSASRVSRSGHHGQVSKDLANLGILLTTLGDLEEALRIHRIHLADSRQQGDSFSIVNALGHIASVRVRLGHHHQAIRIGTAVLAAKYKSNNLHGVAELANDLGTSYRHLQRLTEAMESHRTALAIADTVGELHVRAAALNELALTLIVGGRASEALGRHRKALALATRIGHPYEQGRALDGIASCLVDTDPAEARRHWERALAIFRRIGVPERFEVERRILELSDATTSSASYR